MRTPSPTLSHSRYQPLVEGSGTFVESHKALEIWQHSANVPKLTSFPIFTTRMYFVNEGCVDEWKEVSMIR